MVTEEADMDNSKTRNAWRTRMKRRKDMDMGERRDVWV